MEHPLLICFTQIQREKKAPKNTEKEETSGEPAQGGMQGNCRYFVVDPTQKGKEKAVHKQETHKKKIYPPEDTLEVRFLFLSHVKGLIRGSAPVRIRVSIGRVDALLALVRASAGLSLPESRTTFCKVRLLSIS